MFNRVTGFGHFDETLHLRPAGRSSGLPLELQELIQEQSVHVGTPQAAAESDWPVSIYVPERYEENYAYPLLIWFHDNGHSEGQVEAVMSSLSPQNYCGLGVQGNRPSSADASWDWNTSALDYGKVPLTDLLGVTVRRLRRAFHIHSERIFLAGSGTGADVALHQLLQRPRWYAGAVLFDPHASEHIIRNIPSAILHGRSVLWTVARTASSDLLAGNLRAVRMMRYSGAELDVRVTGNRIRPESEEIRFVDHWLLSQIGNEAFV